MSISLILFVTVLFGLGFAGRFVEQAHFKRLVDHEQMRGDFLVTQLKTYPGAVPGQRSPTMVCAEVVIASDYLKNFFASWQDFFGGEICSYSRMTDRAKREALKRLIDEARSLGYNAIGNFRIETADIGDRRTKGAEAMSSWIGYATAYHCDTRAVTG
ncbi:MAG: heavy metal-binding domain-containing protein [Planctomycetaceae bacterium]|nr:heavy metal-binding domain-containing protein [Planctomycetaceae bacterium]